MRSVSLLGFLFLCSAGLFSQGKLPSTAGKDDVHLRANQMSRADNVINLSGDVVVSMNGITVFADEAQYDVATGDLMPQGHVRIHTEKLRNARVFRLDPGDTPLRMPDGPWRGESH